MKRFLRGLSGRVFLAAAICAGLSAALTTTVDRINQALAHANGNGARLAGLVVQSAARISSALGSFRGKKR
mgnify:CR=1 FL=1